ncbi:MAG: F0F1 ATP synthase subunit delta [Gammaproteobacteria bacterium]
MQLDWVTFLLEVINFLVLVWILQHFLYKPVLAAIEKRRAAIAGELDEAAKARQEAGELEARYRDRLDAWEEEKASLRSDALSDVEKERQRRLAAIQQDVERQEERRKAVEIRQAEELRRKASREAHQEAVGFASRLLERVASPAVEERLVQVAIEDLDAMDAAGHKELRDAVASCNGQVRIQSAYPLGKELRESVVSAVSRAAQADITAEFAHDPSLVSGLRISAGPLVLHANLADELGFFGEGGEREH